MATAQEVVGGLATSFIPLNVVFVVVSIWNLQVILWMKDILHHLIGGLSHFSGISTIQGGAGFLPSTALLGFLSNCIKCIYILKVHRPNTTLVLSTERNLTVLCCPSSIYLLLLMIPPRLAGKDTSQGVLNHKFACQHLFVCFKYVPLFLYVSHSLRLLLHSIFLSNNFPSR